MKKIIFVTGSRADYGKIKSLIRRIEDSNFFELHLFVTGTHNLKEYGCTQKYFIEDRYKNIHIYDNQANSMDQSLAKTMIGLKNFVSKVQPDLIVVHGDRLEALAGSIIGSFNNIKVAHIEGGEVSGSIDESIRHAVTKLSNFHFVSNNEALNRVLQLGEKKENIFNIGSPDIDIMLSDSLPTYKTIMENYNLEIYKYAILIYHPVTTLNSELLKEKANCLMNTLSNTDHEYVVILPNNDTGSEIIRNTYSKFKEEKKFKFYNSVKFEDFLVLLKYCKFIIGNSSAGIREANVYGIPTINIGNRQKGRYNLKDSNIVTIEENQTEILKAIDKALKIKNKCLRTFGDGKSTERFMSILCSDTIWNSKIEKTFSDIPFYNIEERLTYV
ncbi:UDP-N-acetylglucosamine 2-epimerase [Lysinibacillus sp. FSL M8-0134]|uniref:UDP-N-acetylglucosamine 2-epimerase n=1 Tax=Lysinibacillus sp. FSL M8-0134 TaxID=2921717 RepID=UPI003119C55B